MKLNKFIIVIIKFTKHNTLKNRSSFMAQLLFTFKDDTLFSSFPGSATDFFDLG